MMLSLLGISVCFEFPARIHFFHISQKNRNRTLGCLVGGIAWSGAWLVTGGGKGAIGGGIEVAVAFLASYMFGYYRLLLYPASGFSAVKAYFSSLKNPSQVLFYLHHSSLY
jgi:hypothetical protein